MSDGLMMKYFVLKPAGDDAYAAASRAAMFRYALFIREENPALARQIWDWATGEHIKVHGESPGHEIAPEHWAPEARDG